MTSPVICRSPVKCATLWFDNLPCNDSKKWTMKSVWQWGKSRASPVKRPILRFVDRPINDQSCNLPISREMTPSMIWHLPWNDAIHDLASPVKCATLWFGISREMCDPVIWHLPWHVRLCVLASPVKCATLWFGFRTFSPSCVHGDSSRKYNFWLYLKYVLGNVLLVSRAKTVLMSRGGI